MDRPMARRDQVAPKAVRGNPLGETPICGDRNTHKFGNQRLDAIFDVLSK